MKSRYLNNGAKTKSSKTRNPKISPKYQKYGNFGGFSEGKLKSKNRPLIWTREKLKSKTDIWIMVPHLCPQKPGTPQSDQIINNTVFFLFLVKVNLNLKTDHKFELEKKL